MNNAFLFHWNAHEAEKLAEQIQGYGWQIIGVEAKDGARGSKLVRELQPTVVIVYLTRLPSHGRETAAYLQSVKAASPATSQIPIIFVGGKGGALRKTKEKVPAAVYTTPEELESVLTKLA
jgi:response regulator RpfG family c-di-GMP phosphodiesterase